MAKIGAPRAVVKDNSTQARMGAAVAFRVRIKNLIISV